MKIQHSSFAAALLLSATVLTAPPASAQINLTAGDVALIGWVDNGSPADILTIVNLAPMPAGTTLYFTDNGWDGLGYRNTLGPTDGDGNEQLLQFVVNNPIPAGTIISTNTTSADYTWVTSGAIPGTTTGAFAMNALAQAGDQVSVFQHDTGMNPLNTPVQQNIFVLDDTGAFEIATSSAEGDVPTGLSVAGNTAVTFPQNSTGQNFMAFNTGTLSSGTKADWLMAIANAANWTFGASGTLPSGTITVGSGGGGGAFCFGDGTGTACPCSNSGAAGNGCASSVSTAGGHLQAAGSASLTNDQLVLTGSGMPNSSALYFQGTAQQNGGMGAVFGDGLRCAGGAVVRLGTKNNMSGGSQFPAVGDPSVSVRGLVTMPGVRTYQCWYRNAAVFCTASTFNLTNGWEITWVV